MESLNTCGFQPYVKGTFEWIPHTYDRLATGQMCRTKAFNLSLTMMLMMPPTMISKDRLGGIGGGIFGKD